MKKSTKKIEGYFSLRKHGIQGAGLLIGLILIVISSCVSYAQTDESVMKAFELRINGKTDQAKELLISLIEKDSTNAAAHFELTRTLNYINIMGSEEASKELKMALKYDPENVGYAYYNAKDCFLRTFMVHHDGGVNESDVKELLDKVCNEFVKVLEMKSDYTEALMYLVEIYGALPEDMGGDKVKAEEYTQKLDNLDKFYGAKARLILMPQETDRIKYWSDFATNNSKDCRVWKELGVANLFKDNIEEAKKSFEKAIALDQTQNIRLLDLARFHMMKVMQNKDAASTELPKSKEYIEQYLASVPAPLPPLKAYALGMMVNIERFSGNNAEANKLMKEAKSLDPYFSRAMGLPSLALFEPPDKLDHHFQSFFSPY